MRAGSHIDVRKVSANDWTAKHGKTVGHGPSPIAALHDLFKKLGIKP